MMLTFHRVRAALVFACLLLIRRPVASPGSL